MPNVTKESIARNDLEKRFEELATRWKHERGPHSFSEPLAEHAAYQVIIAMGAEVVPLLLRELDREPEYWFRALAALTDRPGSAGVPRQSSGNGRRLAWLGTRRRLRMVTWRSTKQS